MRNPFLTESDALLFQTEQPCDWLCREFPQAYLVKRLKLYYYAWRWC